MHNAPSVCSSLASTRRWTVLSSLLSLLLAQSLAYPAQEQTGLSPGEYADYPESSAIIVDDDFDDVYDSPNKRAWTSNFSGGMGKRAWNSNFSGGLGKRAWNSNFSGGMGKRAWNNGFGGGIGKRAWNSNFSGGMGKRAWNSNFAGGMGKRAWNSNFAGGMGKRAWNSGFSDRVLSVLKRGWGDLSRGHWGKRAEEIPQEIPQSDSQNIMDALPDIFDSDQIQEKENPLMENAVFPPDDLWLSEEDGDDHEDKENDDTDKIHERSENGQTSQPRNRQKRSTGPVYPINYFVYPKHLSKELMKMTGIKRTPTWLQLRGTVNGIWGKRSTPIKQKQDEIRPRKRLFGKIRKIPMLSR